MSLPESPRCPHCRHVQRDLNLRDGRLWSGAVQVLGYVCQRCGKAVHWGIRGAERENGSGGKKAKNKGRAADKQPAPDADAKRAVQLPLAGFEHQDES